MDVPDLVRVIVSTIIYASALLALRAPPPELLALLPRRLAREQ
jgi:hypothetical protein